MNVERKSCFVEKSFDLEKQRVFSRKTKGLLKKSRGFSLEKQRVFLREAKGFVKKSNGPNISTVASVKATYIAPVS